MKSPLAGNGGRTCTRPWWSRPTCRWRCCPQRPPRAPPLLSEAPPLAPSRGMRDERGMLSQGKRQRRQRQCDPTSLDPGWGTSDPARRPGGQGQQPPACCGGEERRPPVGRGAVKGVEMGGGIGHPYSPACCGNKEKMSAALEQPFFITTMGPYALVFAPYKT